MAKPNQINSFDRITIKDRQGLNHEGDLGYVTKADKKKDVFHCYMYNTNEVLELRSREVDIFKI